MDVGTSPLRHSIEHGMFIRAGRDPADAPALVFVHGLGESGLCFEELLADPRLGGWRRLAPDLPGYGRSAWLDEPLTLERQADHLAGWLETRSEPPAVVVGHSMGGVVALLLAERHPGRVAAVIDVEGNKSTGDCVYSGQAACRTLEELLAGGFDAIRDGVYRAGLEDEALRRYYASLRLCDPRAFHVNGLELVEMSAEETLARRLGAIGVPTAYVAGVPKGAAPRSLELVAEADVECRLIDGSGHWPFIDRPDDFLEVLEELLAPRRSRVASRPAGS